MSPHSNCRHDTFTTLVADASYSVAGSVLEAKKLVLFFGTQDLEDGSSVFLLAAINLQENEKRNL